MFASKNLNTYRHDLDGLRGIAIAFVVIFHVFVGKVSGGVDVFLLLSGYFFLGAQLRYVSKEQANLNPWWPLWRTIRRLFPALVLVLISTALVIDLCTPQLRGTTLGSQLWASLLYYQNWQLAADGAAYGAAADTVSPLQHLWSMAVQGQFYLGAIALAIGVGWVLRLAKRRTLRSIKLCAGIPLALITAASFAYATYLHSTDQMLNYYSTWSRLWELTLGALLGLFASTSVPLPMWLRGVMGYVGLAMVLSTGFIFDGALQFPGPATLYPLGGAALVILSNGVWLGWLAARPMRWLGNIAYSLYLWHWPLLIVSTVYFRMAEPSMRQGLAVIAVSLVLAHLTYVLVEQPLRQHAPRPQHPERRPQQAVQQMFRTGRGALRAVTAAVVLVLAVGVWVIPVQWQREVDALANNQLDPRLYPGAMAITGVPVPNMPYEPDPYVLASTVSPAWADGCLATIGDDPSKIRIDEHPEGDCVYGDPDAEFVAYLIGGSHAEQWTAALDVLGKQYGFKLVPIVRQGCPAFAEELDGVFGEDCQEFNRVMLERLLEDRPDLVISTSTRPLPERLRFSDEVPLSYRTLWRFLEDENFAFVGIRDNPWFIEEGGGGWNLSQCLAESGDYDVCGIPREFAYGPEDPAGRILKDKSNMVAVDTSDWFCPDDFCPAVIGNVYIYRDGNHISDDYARSAAPLLWEAMEPVMLGAGWKPAAE